MVSALPAALFLALALSTASAQVEWTFRNPLPTSENLEFVTWGGGQALALGSSGGILTSPDGLAWTRRHSGVQTRLWGAAWTGSRWVVVGDSNRVLTSADGAAWAVADGPGLIRSVAWDGSQVIGVGQIDASAPAIWTSPDGAAWTFRYSGVTQGGFRAVAWTGKLAVAVGNDLATSPDGVAWTPRATPGGLDAVAGNADGMVAIGYGLVLHSRDGSVWTRVPVDLGAARFLFRTGREYLALGNGRLWKSSDGETWEGSDGCEGCTSLAWTGQLLIGAGGDGILRTSPDGRDWISRISGPLTSFVSVAWFGGRFHAAGTRSFATSTDGITWSDSQSLSTGDVQLRTILDFDRHGDRLLATGRSGDTPESATFLFESRDGATWTARKTPSALYRVCWTGTHYLASEGNKLVRSADGLAWDTVASDSAGRTFSQILWTGSQAVAKSTQMLIKGHGTFLSTQFWTSPDGAHWSMGYTDSTRFWHSLAWTGRLLIAGGSGLATSSDGIVWTMRKSGAGILSVHWTGNRAVAVGNPGVTWSSPDGVEWTQHEIDGSGRHLYDVAASGSPGRPGVLVAIGLLGTILSAPEEPGSIAVTPRSAPGSPLLHRLPGSLQVTLPGHPLPPGTRVSLLTLDGRRRLAARQEGNGFAFPLGGLPAGLYLVEVARPGSRLLSLKYLHAP